jgi:fructose-1,6-bisphosphatase/inositol monophosphatase family enzyme
MTEQSTTQTLPHVLLTGDAMGILMKEMVRRATQAIRTRQFIHEVSEKAAKPNGHEDFFTDADREAQRIYQRMIGESFPFFGLIAEEDELHQSGTGEFKQTFFTVDPLDGTKAFIRQEPTCVSTMIALMHQKRVISAYVGDVMAEEIYGFRPGSTKTHRITRNGMAQTLLPVVAKPLRTQYLAIRHREGAPGKTAQTLVLPHEAGGLCRDITMLTGSIGMTFARLWGGSIGAILLPRTTHTPWDWNPVYGISTHMGFAFYKFDDGQKPVRGDFGPLTEKLELPNLLVMHPVFEKYMDGLFTF